MKIDWNSRYTTTAVYVVLTVGICLLLYGVVNNFSYFVGLLKILGGLLLPFVYGFAIAYVLNPALNFFERKVLFRLAGQRLSSRGLRSASLLLTYLVAFAVVALFFRVVLPQVGVSISTIAGQIPGYIGHVQELLRALPEQIDQIELSQETVNTISLAIESGLSSLYQLFTQSIPVLLSFTISFTSGVIKFILGIIISIYVLASKERFFAQSKKVLCAFLKKDTVERLIAIAHESHEVFSGFISGKLLDSFIIGVLCFIGMSIFQMPYAMLISVIVGITNVIPYFGPFIGAIPSAIIILMVDPIEMLWFVLFILVLQQFDGNILGPKILGESIGLSAFWVVFAIIVFGGLFNVVGMFIGVPVFAVIYSLIRRMVEGRLLRRGLPPETQEYASPDHPIPKGKPQVERPPLFKRKKK